MATAKITAISQKIEPIALLEMAKEKDLEGVAIIAFKKDGSMVFDRCEVDNVNLIYALEVVKQIVLEHSSQCPGCDNCDDQ